MEIKVGRTYRAKKPAMAGYDGYANDRQVLHVSMDGYVQYDGPSVHAGRNYPRVSMDAFQKWASRDITDEMRPGEWDKFHSGLK